MPNQRVELGKELGVFDYSSGSTRRYDLPVTGYIKKLTVELSAVSVVTTAGPGVALIRNPGSLIPSLQVIGNGKDVIKQMSFNHYRDFMYMAQRLPTETADSAAANTTTVVSTIDIFFENPLGVNPGDTILDCVNQFSKLELGVSWASYEDGVVNAATSAAFTTDPTIRVTADIDYHPPARGVRGVFRQYETILDSLSTGTSTARNIELVTGENREYNSFLIVAEDDLTTAAGGLNLENALTSIELRQIGRNTTSPFGPKTGGMIQQEFFRKSRTPETAAPTGLYPIPFVAMAGDGLDSYNAKTYDLKDFRFVIDQSTAFTTNGQITVLEGIIDKTSV